VVSSSVSGRRGEARRPALELGQELARVHEVAVVADRDGPPRPEPERRLGVLQIVEPVVE
jgi:hypothetical protein